MIHPRLCSVCVLLFVVVSFVAPMNGQRGTAPPGYYPSGYGGDTFTGKVVSVDPTAQQFTLRYEHGKKLEEFTGTLDGPCTAKMVDGRTSSTKVENFPDDAILTALYITRHQKNQPAISHVFAISFVAANGKPTKSHAVIYCGTGLNP